MTSLIEDELPHCLYVEDSPDPAAHPTLERDARTRTVVIGGGYTGLSTALHLAEQGGEVIVLEAREPAWGAAGRNGGQVNAGLKSEPDAMIRQFGPVHGPAMVRFSLGSPAMLFTLIERLQIQCHAVQNGTLRAASTQARALDLEIAAEQWKRHGFPVQLWNRERMVAETGTSRYVAGLFDPRGGAVDPLALARGIAQAASRAGAKIFSQSPAVGLAKTANGWQVRTPCASVHAENVVLATGAYTDDLWPGLRTSFIPAYSSIVATEQMPDALAATIMPGGQVVYENGHITAYYRRDHKNRLLMGGRGAQSSARNRIDYQHLIAYAGTLWPALKQVAWTYWWNGQLALTPDFSPRFHVPAPGLFIIVGYARGIALGTAFGAELAALASGAPLETFPLPVSTVSSIPLHRFWRLGVKLRVIEGRMRDRFQR